MANKEFRSPVYNIIAVPFEKIVPNTYNPNNVAPPEMRLLYDSIKEDGYTTVSYTHLTVLSAGYGRKGTVHSRNFWRRYWRETTSTELLRE